MRERQAPAVQPDPPPAPPPAPQPLRGILRHPPPPPSPPLPPPRRAAGPEEGLRRYGMEIIRPQHPPRGAHAPPIRPRAPFHSPPRRVMPYQPPANPRFPLTAEQRRQRRQARQLGGQSGNGGRREEEAGPSRPRQGYARRTGASPPSGEDEEPGPSNRGERAGEGEGEEEPGAFRPRLHCIGASMAAAYRAQLQARGEDEPNSPSSVLSSGSDSD